MSARAEELANRLGSMDRKTAGLLGEAFARALGITVRHYEAPAQAAPVIEKVEEQTEFAVMLAGFEAPSKLSVIKEIRARLGLGLVESKALVENSEKQAVAIREGLPKAEAEALQAALAGAGAKVKLA